MNYVTKGVCAKEINCNQTSCADQLAIALEKLQDHKE